jgi:carbamoyltransferase
MTVSVRVRDPEDPRHRGVIHLDGTVRPQVLTPAGNPGLHRLLRAFHARTGIPSLVNTSFNLHGEPIVNTPDEAIATWRAAGLDALLLGPFVVTQPAPAGSRG